jgi:hypothetical protein
MRLRVGETEGPLFDVITLPVKFGSSDDHFVYAGADNRRYFAKEERRFGQVLIDGKEGQLYEAAPIQSTGKSILGALGGSLVTLTKGISYSNDVRWDGVSSPTLSPDGNHIAYSARRGNNDYVLITDGAEGAAYEAIPCGPSYSPDGQLFYAAFSSGKLMVMANGKQLAEFPWQTDTWKDSDRCVGFAFWRPGHYAFLTEQDWSRFREPRPSRRHHRVFIDGKSGEEYQSIAVSTPLLAQYGEGVHVAYAVADAKTANGKSFVVLDEQQGKPFDQVFVRSMAFSDEGNLTYIVRNGRQFLRITQPLGPS